MILAMLVSAWVTSTATAATVSRLESLVVGTGSTAGNAALSTNDNHRWRLAPSNKTTKIDNAYKYGDNVIIFGWIGCCSGVTTILDAVSGTEKLEFLDYYPHITTTGILVFEQFYPHFTDPGMISDKIRALNLNDPVPVNVPPASQNPTDDVGVTLYPGSSEKGARHLIGNAFVVDDMEERLFIVDRPPSGHSFCFARLSLMNLTESALEKHCTTATDLTGKPGDQVAIYAFNFNEYRELVLSVNTELAEHSLKLEYFEIDRQTLIPKRMATRSSHALPVPWKAQKQAVVMEIAPTMTQKDLSEHAKDTANISLLIDEQGNVKHVSITGVPDDVARWVTKAVLQWKFKPTVLDGIATDVSTSFAMELSRIGHDMEP